jgi:hypothetical protein
MVRTQNWAARCHLWMQRFILGAIITLLCLPVPAQALTLEGHLVQGGMAIGRVDPAATVYFHGKAVRVSPDGLFVIGFSRDAEAESVIELHQPSGTVEKHPVSIEKRTYKIQRIDGLPPRKVTPSAEDLERIGKEIALVKSPQKGRSQNRFFACRSSGRSPAGSAVFTAASGF